MSDTKNKILNDAFKLFIEKGFTDVSLNELAESVGISKAGFYHYFKSKDELLNEVIKEYLFSYLDERLEKISECDGDLEDKLKVFVMSYSEYQNRCICKSNGEKIDFRSFYLLMMEGIKKYDFLNERLLYFYTRAKQMLENILSEEKKNGKLKSSTDIEGLTEHIALCCEGIVMVQVINPDSDIRQITNNTFEHIHELVKIYMITTGGE